MEIAPPRKSASQAVVIYFKREVDAVEPANVHLPHFDVHIKDVEEEHFSQLPR